MPRRSMARASRAAGLSSSRPTPVRAAAQSTARSPVVIGESDAVLAHDTSIYSYHSNDDADDDDDADADNDDVSNIPLSSLSLQDAPHLSQPPPPGPRKKKPGAPFPFLSLPAELRIKVYEYHFSSVGDVIDLEPDNYKRIHKALALLRTCCLVNAEASHVLFRTPAFRLFPTHPGRYFKTKKPLLARLSARQRSCITALELRLGPGWNRPPRGWVVNAALGLRDCAAVRRLTVFVECDPSDGVFNGFRRADGFYEHFCADLLADVLRELPTLDKVHFDAWSSVKKSGDMMRGLLQVARSYGRAICWGPERGWTNDDENEEEKGKEQAWKKAVVSSGSGSGSGGIGHGIWNSTTTATTTIMHGGGGGGTSFNVLVVA